MIPLRESSPTYDEIGKQQESHTPVTPQTQAEIYIRRQCSRFQSLVLSSAIFALIMLIVIVPVAITESLSDKAQNTSKLCLL